MREHCANPPAAYKRCVRDTDWQESLAHAERRRRTRPSPCRSDWLRSTSVWRRPWRNTLRSFFSPFNYPDFCEFIGKPLREGQAISLFSASDFLTFVERSNLLPDDPARYMHQIRHLLNRMAANNLLTQRWAPPAKNVMMPERYFSWAGAHISTLQKAGLLWLAGTLRGRFVHQQVSPAIVHIVGSDKHDKDKPRSGSGIVFDRRHVLTCRHVVVADMVLNSTQNIPRC